MESRKGAEETGSGKDKVGGSLQECDATHSIVLWLCDAQSGYVGVCMYVPSVCVWVCLSLY